MKYGLADKLRELRRAKNVSQEKFAGYLGVSYQAVSKWENGVTSPDISLLPDIARYFSITVDELLGAEYTDEGRYFDECCEKAYALYRNGEREGVIALWLEAYRRLPNSIRVREMLMSAYFDTDKIKYRDEIIELGSEIYSTVDLMESGGSYYSGQAISQIACTYAVNGNPAKAEEWARKAHQLCHSQEMVFMQISDDESELTAQFGFANRWYFEQLFYMTMRLNECDVKLYGADYVQKVNKAAAAVLELAYPDDDTSFEGLRRLCVLYRCIAEDETKLGKDEAVIDKYLTRAVECAEKSAQVKAHRLTHPLVYGTEVAAAPSDNKQIIRALKEELTRKCFEPYQNQSWFTSLLTKLDAAL